jgi:hypothetical protein
MMGPHGSEIAWPSKPLDKKSRTVHNHHISLRERLKEYQSRTQEKHPKAEGGARETTKAAAWAVFQRHGGGGLGLSQTHGSAVQRPTRFKIEAQMKHGVKRPSVSESVAASWDAGSTLFDSFELDSLLKTLDQAANSAGAVSQQNPKREQKQADEEAGAIVVYSQKHWLTRPNPNPPPQRHSNKLQGQRSFPGRGALDDVRLDTVDETRPLATAGNSGQRPASYTLAGNLTLDDLYKQGQEDADSDLFANFGHTPSPFNVRRNARRSFDSSLQSKSGKSGSGDFQRSKWKSLLHTLHLDSASGLFNRFQGFHAQVAPHDSHKKLENKASRSRAKTVAKFDQTDHSSYSPKHSIVSATEVSYDPRFDPKNLHISKDVHLPAVKDDHQRSPPPQSWKSGLKAAFSRPFSRQGSLVSQKSVESASPKQSPLATLEAPRKGVGQRWQKKTELQSAWSSLTTKLQPHQDGQEQRRGQRARSMIETVSLSHHEHHHHYHHHHVPVPPEAADYELTVQAISRRVSRSSFEEKARKFSIEEGGTKAPRNSLATPRSSGDPSAHEERIRARLTPWEAESSFRAKGAFVH